MTLIGLISDTHGLVRPEARVALTGVDRIIHAGDICNEEVLEELERIAPVLAVRGNNDRGTWTEILQETETVDIDGVRIHVVHDLAQMEIDPRAERVDVVISGHSHRPLMKMEGTVLYVNPGSAGPRRFKLPISVAYLEVDEGRAKARLKTLEVD
ncbi:metallophosphoesterase family protein [Noviherbaspirillum galbum]|uniref:Phosphoesterase n=1 Tax=Noviherbaspirillum galbum TaxID=2709383 RepID=A0A6B3ST07_9BURK|nr:metallophosphoesterase family protein [Noviherbaspirillum galbum]NEX63794.1 metallophosphoesterase family protein [Noviherbaspirillum galbum]